ncbi:hypothetical protein HME9304_01929 [Flagellimonas maritima]|uniref:Uncharacterized protein n=1 Tax=Flagellimonas maritima TaxID=1383885 RepID=A0A2Z4LSX3_9FLAO|nr:hypothetical protein HME9304_01929 [Allomuricauda aurantiaca]
MLIFQELFVSSYKEQISRCNYVVEYIDVCFQLTDRQIWMKYTNIRQRDFYFLLA